MRIENRGFKVTILLLFVLACLAMFVMLYRSAGGAVPFQDKYSVKALLPTAFNLVNNSDVRRAGVKIGKVTDVTNRGDEGLVTLQLDDEHAPLYRDATVRLRTKTLVGENYLDVDPGTPSTGRMDDGSTLPVEQAGEAVQLDEILDTLDAKTKAQVQKNLDGLGPGFEGRGADTNRLFAAMRPLVVDGGLVAGILEQQKGKVASLVDDAADVMQAFGDRSRQLRTLARQAKTTAQVVAERDEQFGAAIDELDPTLRQAQFSVNKLGSFSGKATPVIRDVKVAANGLTPLMRDLRPAAALATPLFREIPALSNNLNPLLDELRSFSPALEKAVQPLDSVLRQTNPALEFITPYQREFAAFFGNVGSAVDFQDNFSSLARVFALIGPGSISGALDENERKALNALIDAGGLGFLANPRYNPVGKPGSGAKPSTDDNFRQVTPDPPSVGG